jgi:uncharacterized membrane protein
LDPTRLLYLASVWLHVLAAALWVGGMLFLVLVVVPLLAHPDLRPHARLLVAELGTRFRSVGWATLVTLVVTGVLNVAARFQAAGVLADPVWWAAPFGRRLAEKLGLVAVILVLSAVHDFWVGPRAAALWQADPDGARTRRWRAAAAWLGRLNLLLGLLVIALAVALVRGGF